MKKLFTFSLFIVAVVIQGKAQNKTWADNVACIFYTHCTSCHNTNGAAPFSLTDYTTASSYALAIQDAVTDKHMPPWPSDESYQQHAHPRVLSQEEIDIINEWVNGGAPEGNSANAPAAPVYSGASTIVPDKIFKMQDYTVTTVKDLYRCFVIPSGFTVDQFLTSFEIIPGNRNIVHHVLVYQDTANTTVNLDAQDPDPGYTSFGGVGSSTAKLVGAWVPGSQPYVLPNSMGIKILKKANIILQVHYPGGITSTLDSTKILMKISQQSNLRNVSIEAALNHVFGLVNGPLFIPANTTKTFYTTYKNSFGVYTLLGVAPHMHLVGKSIKAFAVGPQNDTTKLINIPEWDFHWQGEYQFRKPIKLKQGSTLWGEAFYDNTTDNPHNPNNPPKDVALGEATTDEMFLVYFSYLPYQPGDENIIIDTSTVTTYYNNCSITSVGSDNDLLSFFELYPNPGKEKINCSFTLKAQDVIKAEVYDLQGKKVAVIAEGYYPNGNHRLEIDMDKWTSGTYVLKLQTSEGQSYKKIIHQ